MVNRNTTKISNKIIMAIKSKEKKEDKFIFAPTARAYFAKELAKSGFDFDKMLLSKQALKKVHTVTPERTFPSLVAIEYETMSEQSSYISKYISNTPYYSFEASTVDRFWKFPTDFWYELRSQSRNEEYLEWITCENLEETRTGKSHHERARDKIKELRDSVMDIIKDKTMPKYDLNEYGNPNFM